jgi:tetratricopeptide (TPR) repeat protein
MSEEKAEARRAKELLGEATLLRLRGELEQALAKCEQAIQLEGFDWEGHELLGDLRLELEQPAAALEAYRRARDLNPGRGRLEEKIGLAAIAQAREAALRQRSLDIAEGRLPREPARRPALAALFSLVIPGLGQVYNREPIKGAGIVCCYLILLAGMILSALKGIYQLRQSGLAIDPGAVVSLFFQGGTLLLTLLTAALWVFAVIDAAFQASRSMTSDETGMV